MTTNCVARRPRGATVQVTLLLALGLLTLAGCGGGDVTIETSTPIDITAAVPRALVAAAALPMEVAASAAEPPSPSIVEAPRDAVVAAGQLVQFSVRAEGPPAISYQWLRDGETIAGAVGVVYQQPVDEADHLARFSVLVRAGDISIRSRAATLRVAPG